MNLNVSFLFISLFLLLFFLIGDQISLDDLINDVFDEIEAGF
jgi:hypothetical protein